MPQLIIEQPGMPTFSVPVLTGEISLGRAEENDVVLVAEEVSRHHAKIIRRGGQAIIRDLNSLNGTFVNGQRVVERALKHLDEILLGAKCKMVYRDDTRFGADASRPATVRHESRLDQSVRSIREEMDRVGSAMTLIGRRGTPPPEKETPVPSQEELVRIGRAYRRLEALHRANQAMLANTGIQNRLSHLLDVVLETLEGDRGFILLREEKQRTLRVMVARAMGRDLEASSPSMGIAGRAAIDGESVLMTDVSQDDRFSGRESVILSRIASAVCVPLRVEDRIVGSIYIDTRKPDMKFSEEDVELLESMAGQAALAIDNLRLQEKILEEEKRRENLSRFLPKPLVDKVLSEPGGLQLGGQKMVVATLFCDIRGSSQLAEALAPHDLVMTLNEHFTAMTEIVFRHEGTLDKYIGDEIMAVFGAPFKIGNEAYRAVATALEMQQKTAELNVVRAHEGRPVIQIGIGIDLGEAIAGYIGSPRRMDFTVVGDRVNTAKRFCDLAGPGKIVVGDGIWQALQGYIVGRPLGTQQLKGKQQAVRVYEIQGLRPSPVRGVQAGQQSQPGSQGKDTR
ncbi:MAG TPA: adenylate/guanylate cyclase domain-containing protein [Candidatus Hydrogenedentes bacterium]|nr:GAF domain-containing protein [Candidatus Hydrogenedentota bacterium]HOJ68674.1 adenylate/guanylate cyclase domain-containing protein [Candidatus Hydrogenedentota bacterium]HOK88854.1 adenylate/guanylate cyclase domain-containing protein [Candidatus Hydrogenedentota bacterium]